MQQMNMFQTKEQHKNPEELSKVEIKKSTFLIKVMIIKMLNTLRRRMDLIQ